MRYLITSDLHLGNQFSQCLQFIEMLQRLNDSVTLVLAGDIIDAPGQVLKADAKAALDTIQNRSLAQTVIWIEGNHDEGFRPPGSHNIEFRRSFTIDKRFYITHGDSFDHVMPNNRWFVELFLFFHKLRVRLGADPVHVADYAKKYKVLYCVLCRKVMMCAVDYAAYESFDAVVCGHVHFMEDSMHNGIRYINLGAWTELPCHCLLVDDNSARLLALEEAFEEAHWFSRV